MVEDVILRVPWWRESDELQAIGRAHCLGQDHVHVYRLHGMVAIVDDVMRRISKRKAEVYNQIIGQIRRPDDEKPHIPKQEKWGVGEG